MDGYWFRKKPGQVFMRPVNSGGYWCLFWYLVIVSTPPIAVAFSDLKVDGLILFLLAGHVSLFTLTFYIAARLHCFQEQASLVAPKN